MAMVAKVFPRVDAGRVVADGPSADFLEDDALLVAHGLERPCLPAGSSDRRAATGRPDAGHAIDVRVSDP